MSITFISPWVWTGSAYKIFLILTGYCYHNNNNTNKHYPCQSAVLCTPDAKMTGRSFYFGWTTNSINSLYTVEYCTKIKNYVL